MASSDTEICNSALIKIGADLITSIDDGNKAARLCKQQFIPLRDELIRAHPWNFAIKRMELGKTLNVPVFQWESDFPTGSSLLKIQALLLSTL